jgi:hypothetical protein
MLAAAPACYGTAERFALVWLGLRTSESKRAVYVGEQAMLEAMGFSRTALYRVLARLAADGLVVPMHKARAGARQRYQLVDRAAPICGRHPGCTQSRVPLVGPSASRSRHPRPAHEGPAGGTPNGERRLNGGPDHLAPIHTLDLRRNP